VFGTLVLLTCHRAKLAYEFGARGQALTAGYALLVRDRPGDTEKAAALQKAALVTARELEMRPLIEKILDWKEIT
jgi:hypothetical protein